MSTRVFVIWQRAQLSCARVGSYAASASFASAHPGGNRGSSAYAILWYISVFTPPKSSCSEEEEFLNYVLQG